MSVTLCRNVTGVRVFFWDMVYVYAGQQSSCLTRVCLFSVPSCTQQESSIVACTVVSYSLIYVDNVLSQLWKRTWRNVTYRMSICCTLRCINVDNVSTAALHCKSSAYHFPFNISRNIVARLLFNKVIFFVDSLYVLATDVIMTFLRYSVC